MNKIIVEVSVGELLDKISILEIKQEKIKDQEKLEFINLEHKILKDQLNQNVKTDEKLEILFSMKPLRTGFSSSHSSVSNVSLFIGRKS